MTFTALYQEAHLGVRTLTVSHAHFVHSLNSGSSLLCLFIPHLEGVALQDQLLLPSLVAPKSKSRVSSCLLVLPT